MKFLALFFLTIGSLFGATRYVDSSATGANNGTSWTDAWTNVNLISASPGDTIYISGGPSGSTRTYVRNAEWNPPSGNSGARITYQIGQDSSHNGTAIFDGTTGPGTLLSQTAYVNFVGDAGDGAQHFRLVGFYRLAESFSYTRLAYFYADDSHMHEFLNAVAPSGTATNGLEIDHNYVRISDMTSDHAIYFGSAGTIATDNKFHHNVMHGPRLSAGYGIDFFQAGNAGYSFYNNTCVGYLAAYTGGQHQDGFQVAGATNVDIYNNTFLNVANYAIFLEGVYGYSNVRVFNNVCILNDPGPRAGNPGGIVCGAAADNISFTNVTIANNAVVGYKPNDASSGLSLSNSNGRTGVTFTNCKLVNNLSIDGPNAPGYDSAVAHTNNVYLTAAQAARRFVNYSQSAGLDMDLRVQTAATTLIGAGLDLSSIFTTDLAGGTRTGSWTVGPYQNVPFPTPWYVDNTATAGTHDGSSWANAFLNTQSVTGQLTGDVVYISGGPSGSSQTYQITTDPTYPGQWINVQNGVTYKIGQDPSHNGLAIFDGGVGGGYMFQQNLQNITISGDAGDGQRHFKLINAFGMSYGDGSHDVRFSYIDAHLAGGENKWNGCHHIEVDHCYMATLGTTSNSLSFGLFVSAENNAYDVNKFHHNYVELQRPPTLTPTGGNGTDGLEWVGNGYSIYNNTFVSLLDGTWLGNQHQDGWQGSGGSYIKIYNNIFINIENYAIFMEPSSGSYAHVRIYNNIAWTVTSKVHAETQAWALAANSLAGKTCTDVVLSNNLSVGFGNPSTFRNPIPMDDPAGFIECYCYNNVDIAALNGNIIDPNVHHGNNVTFDSSQAAARYVSFVRDTMFNDYHPKPGATDLIGNGTSQAAFFTEAADGATRAGPWTIGPLLKAGEGIGAGIFRANTLSVHTLRLP